MSVQLNKFEYVQVNQGIYNPDFAYTWVQPE